MYILERLIGVTTYTVALVTICFFVSKSSHRNIGKVLFLYKVLLAFMAYFYVPSVTADLYRLTQTMNYLNILDSTGLKKFILSSTTPISYLYMAIIGKFGNDNLLPAITAYIYYTNIFYVFNKYVSKNKISPYTCAVVLFFFMSSGQFLGIISGIRNHLAFSIIAVCVYREMVEKKSFITDIPLYIIAALMHNAALALVLIRFGYLIFQKSDKIYNKVLYSIFLVILIILSVKYGTYYLNAMMEKAKAFLSGYIYIDKWMYLISLTQLLTIIFMKFKMKKISNYTNGDINLKDIYNFSKLICFICIIFFVEYSIFTRFISFLTIVSIPWILQGCDSKTMKVTNGKKYFGVRVNLLFVSSCILLLACIRGSLSGLKFFVL